MAVDKPLNFQGLIALLSIPPQKRLKEEIDQIFKATMNFKFFQDLTSKDDSSKLHIECCKCLTINSFLENDFICRRGDPGTAFYLILKGSVRILALAPEDPEPKNRLKRKTPKDSILKVPSHQALSSAASDQEEKEIAILGTGYSFGEMALMNDRPRYFSVQCIEDTVLGVLQKSDYHIIAKVQEKQINEKIEFLRSLEAFKTWTRVAIYKLSYFFKSFTYRKGMFVYKEGDMPNEVFFIKEGEFLFTQNYSIDAGLKNPSEIFGALKKTREIRVFRKKQLNVVIKQKGEIFGVNEIVENKDRREFTCICSSTFGEVLAISDRNFNKKLVQPDTVKYIEESCSQFKNWIEKRLEGLKDTEKFKDSVSFTPLSKIQASPRRERSVSPIINAPIINSPEPTKIALPIIIDKILVNNRNKSYSNHAPFMKTPIRGMFKTETEPPEPKFIQPRTHRRLLQTLFKE